MAGNGRNPVWPGGQHQISLPACHPHCNRHSFVEIHKKPRHSANHLEPVDLRPVCRAGDKNWLWTGNPIYPLIWGGPGRSLLTERLFSEYVGSFGFGHGWLDLVLLPYRMFAYPIRFSIIRFEFFHPALWLAFGNFFFLRSKKRGIPLLYSSLVLLPVSAFLAILAANTLERFPRLLQKSVILILGGTILLSVSFQISYLQRTRIVPYLAGQISARQLLREQALSFRMMEY
jgi:hypothetical protein